MVLLVDVIVGNVEVLVVVGVDEPNDARASIAVSGVVVVEMVTLGVGVVVTGKIAVMLRVMLLMDVVVRNGVVLVVVSVDGHVVTEVGAVGVLVVVPTTCRSSQFTWCGTRRGCARVSHFGDRDTRAWDGTCRGLSRA